MLHAEGKNAQGGDTHTGTVAGEPCALAPRSAYRRANELPFKNSLPEAQSDFMRAVIQRVLKACVSVAGEKHASIEQGLLVLVGVGSADSAGDVSYLAEKTAGLRIFEDAKGRMNRSVEDIGGALLVVSQFTIFGDVRSGRRPNFRSAATSKKAELLYGQYVDQLKSRDLKVETGIFQAAMKVDLVNYGPVTILLDSKKNF